MRVAITREVPERISECELTHLERVPIDRARAVAQHEQYEAALVAMGCRVERLPATPELPDSVFVEDAAVVFPELAIITRPGALTRRDETASVAEALGRYRPLRFIDAPGTVDGGDVLCVGRRVFVGLSSRTSPQGARQLRDILVPLGYSVETIETAECLHLKSAATALDDTLVLVNPEWIDVRMLGGLRILDVDPAEPFAANVLRIGDVVFCALAAPLTRGRIEALGLETIAIDVSELAKAEAGVTCCSLIIDVAGGQDAESAQRARAFKMA